MAEESPKSGAGLSPRAKPSINKNILTIVVVGLIIVLGAIYYFVFGRTAEKKALDKNIKAPATAPREKPEEYSYIALAEDAVTIPFVTGQTEGYLEYLAVAKVSLTEKETAELKKRIEKNKPWIKDKFRELIIEEEYLKLKRNDTKDLKRKMLKALEENLGKTEIEEIVFERWRPI